MNCACPPSRSKSITETLAAEAATAEPLTLVHACADCGSGEFESPPLRDAADVGYALSAWRPAHPNCQEEDSPYWLYAEQ